MSTIASKITPKITPNIGSSLRSMKSTMKFKSSMTSHFKAKRPAGTIFLDTKSSTCFATGQRALKKSLHCTICNREVVQNAPSNHEFHKSFFLITITFFSYSWSEQFSKQNTIFKTISPHCTICNREVVQNAPSRTIKDGPGYFTAMHSQCSGEFTFFSSVNL